MRFLGVTAAVLALAAPAAAAAHRDPAVTSLQRQVAQLKAQVASLRAEVTAEKNQRLCRLALADDTNRAIFAALNQFAKFLTGSTVPAWDTYLGMPRYDDQGSCAAAGIPRP